MLTVSNSILPPRYLDGLGLIIIIGLAGGTIYPISTIHTSLKIAGVKLFNWKELVNIGFCSPL